MGDRDLQAVKLYGMLATVSGALMMLATLIALGIILATGGTTNLANFVYGATVFIALLILSAALAGIGGDLQRAERRTTLGRENLRLDWTALFIVLAAEFGLGLWLFQPLALVSAFYFLGLLLIRRPVVHLTTR